MQQQPDPAENPQPDVTPPQDCPRTRTAFLDEGVFRLRWLLLPFILGLGVIAMSVLSYQFLRDLVELFTVHKGTDETMAILTLLDKFMVATLLVTTVMGGYQIYLRPIKTRIGWLPTWLREMTSKELKIVTCLSLAGVTGIGLLEDFHQGVDWYHLSEHLAIHFTFLLSAIAVALVDKWRH